MSHKYKVEMTIETDEPQPTGSLVSMLMRVLYTEGKASDRYAGLGVVGDTPIIMQEIIPPVPKTTITRGARWKCEHEEEWCDHILVSLGSQQYAIIGVLDGDSWSQAASLKNTLDKFTDADANFILINAGCGQGQDAVWEGEVAL